MTGTAFKSATGLAAMTRKRETGPEELLDLYFEPVAAPPVNRPLCLSMAPSDRKLHPENRRGPTYRNAIRQSPRELPSLAPCLLHRHKCTTSFNGPKTT